jgi:hypothetical protein
MRSIVRGFLQALLTNYYEIELRPLTRLCKNTSLPSAMHASPKQTATRHTAGSCLQMVTLSWIWTETYKSYI